MNHAAHNKLVSFIWSIADDCLRDVYVRGKYRDVILPMVVLRRLDALLEPSKDKVMEELAFQKNAMGLTEPDDSGLKDASGYVFYNTSKWTLNQLLKTATNNQQILLANVEDYLHGFSANVKEIIDKFNLKSQVRHMAGKDVLFDVLEKFTSPYINLTPNDQEDPDGARLPALTNLGMGYVFEQLIRLETADKLRAELGETEYADFNLFKEQVDSVLKAQGIKLTAGDKNAIFNAVSWYDETAEKVVAEKLKLGGDKLMQLLRRLDCGEAELADFGYYPTAKKGEYLTYESSVDLRDSESVPLKDSIHRYFLAEVKPHVAEAWINLDSTKIGYEISFNKYFYRHKPLRGMPEVARDILALEKQAEGLIADILGVDMNSI